MIYLASPYSNPDPNIRRQRFEAVRDYAAHMMNTGLVVFSPIAYGHQFAVHYDSGTCHISWLDFNEHMLLASTEMVVLKLVGWESSEGIQHEIEFALRNGIEVSYHETI